MDVTALLNALSSPDASLRQPAEQQVEAAKQSNMVRGAATSPSSHPRRLAGLSVAFAIQGSSTRQLLMQLLLVTAAAAAAIIATACTITITFAAAAAESDSADK